MLVVVFAPFIILTNAALHAAPPFGVVSSAISHTPRAGSARLFRNSQGETPAEHEGIVLVDVENNYEAELDDLQTNAAENAIGTRQEHTQAIKNRLCVIFCVLVFIGVCVLLVFNALYWGHPRP